MYDQRGRLLIIACWLLLFVGGANAQQMLGPEQYASSPGGSGIAGHVSTPLVIGGTATLVATCSSAGCTDDERVSNGSNSGTLTLITPPLGAMTDGAILKVTVIDTGTAPSSIAFTAGIGITFKSAATGDVDATPGSVTACGTPPVTGAMVYRWELTSSQLRLFNCGPDPAPTTISTGLGGMIGATFGIGFDFISTPAASQIEALNLAFTANVPANYTGPTSTCSCGTNPSETDAYTVKCNGVSKGTFSLSTSCVLTLPTQTAYTCTAGQRFEFDAPATVSGKDIACTIAYTR